jgi:hypothetical protein
MTPGETARTVIAKLEADIHGDLTEERFTELLIGETDIDTIAALLGGAIQLFTALATRHAESAQEVLNGHRAVSFDLD